MSKSISFYNQLQDFLLTWWRHKFFGLLLKFALGLVVYQAVIRLYSGGDSLQASAIIGLAFGAISVLIVELQVIRSDNERSNNEIREKIYRKLIQTNALIEDRSSKITFTAKVLNEFPDETIYKKSNVNINNRKSIDVVRFYSFQNLLLTPKYIEYFFYRKESVSEALRVIVVNKGQIGQNVCQATLTYIYLSARSGYNTHIMPEKKYREFIDKHCSKVDFKKFIKGNPFVLEDSATDQKIYTGEFIDYRVANDDDGTVRTVNNIEYWELLQKLILNSRHVEPKSTGFSNYIKSSLKHCGSVELI